MKYKYFKVVSRGFCAAVTLKFGAALEETVRRCTVHACTVPGAGMLSKGLTDLTTVYEGDGSAALFPVPPRHPPPSKHWNDEKGAELDCSVTC